MDIEADIRELPAKTLLGRKIEMSVAANQTTLLWQGFMPRRDEIPSAVSKNLWAVQVYPSHYFEQFDPTTKFLKWAAVEVDEVTTIPEGMELLKVPAGLYAVFLYKGHSGNPEIFHYIYGEWLPASGYLLDNRPHFELLGEKFKLNDPLSEEEIWIPVRK
ncbi:MAG: GyrI-like domain-containing protein [Flavobacteriaceae bacterium]